MKAITPVVAVIVLMLMTVGAAGMAFLTITSYQQEAQKGTQGGLESIGSKTKAQLKIESISDGQIYLRNLGSETFSNPSFYVEGKPLNVSGPSECESGDICVYTVLEAVECEGECELSMGADAPVGTSMTVEEEQITAYSITTFSDGYSAKNITFSQEGTDVSVKVKIPISATISSATLNVDGLAVGTMDSSSDYIITGENNNDIFSVSVSASDLNKDNNQDLLIGAMGYPSGSNKGREYIFWGNGSGQFSYSNNYTIDGENNNDRVGITIYSGDINKDNDPDLLLGILYYPSGNEKGRVCVFWGNSTGDFDASRNYTIDGENNDDQFGGSITSGDINNDGYDDMIVGARDYLSFSRIGRTYIFWGNSTGDFDASRNYTITGENDGDQFGISVFSDDINNDGYDDVIVGAQGYPSASHYGKAYVFWGNQTSDFSSANNYTVVGENSNDRFGSAVSSADINNDGYSELIVGADQYLSGALRGRVYVFWGNETEDFDYRRNYTITGENDSDRLGIEFSSGDVNSDGYNDLLASAPRYPSGNEKGRVYIFWGNQTSDFDASRNYTIDGENNYDRFGVSLFSTDMNNDNNQDLLVGAHYYPSDNRKGRAYIFLQNKNYTTSPQLYPGTNITSSWSYSGEFSTTQVANIKSVLNSILPDCNCQGCSISGSDCIIDLNITSQSTGKIQMSNLQITYT